MHFNTPIINELSLSIPMQDSVIQQHKRIRQAISQIIPFDGRYNHYNHFM